MRAKLNNHFKARNSLQSVPPGVTQHDLPCVVQKKRCPSKNYILLYRVFQVKCNITKRHISASRADKMILKKVLESSMNTIFYVKNS